MKFGLCSPNFGRYASKELIVKLAKLAEDEGFDSIWTTDHIILPRGQHEPYGNLYEALITLAYLASICERLKLGTSILVLPYRNPIIVAKQTAALDALSDGRLILGLGVGWNEDEFRFLNADFKHRGRFVDEAIEAMRILWRDEVAEFKGRFTNFSDSIFYPKPIQKNGIPLWIGGDSPAAIRRAATLGDAWHPVGLSFEDLRRGVEALRSFQKPNRRVSVTTRYEISIREEHMMKYKAASGLLRTMISGSIRQIRDAVYELDRIGVEHLVCYFGEAGLEEQAARLKIFSREIMPSFKE